MTEPADTLPPALRRALDLLADPPAEPDVGKGYLDLLGDTGDDLGDDTDQAGPTKNTGTIQALWASDIGSMLYDNVQAVGRKLLTAWQHPVDWLNLPDGGIALDVGSGPGNVTSSLASAAGPDGLAIGVDISEPMLARAVKAEAGPRVGFLRADAQALPLRDATVHAVISIAMLQLIPDPVRALSEMVRVLRPRGRMVIMVPTSNSGLVSTLFQLIPNTGAYFFGEDELADVLEDHGMTRVRLKQLGPIQWIRAQKPA